jgi:hypothetical protein
MQHRDLAALRWTHEDQRVHGGFVVTNTGPKTEESSTAAAPRVNSIESVIINGRPGSAEETIGTNTGESLMTRNQTKQYRHTECDRATIAYN